MRHSCGAAASLQWPGCKFTNF